MIQFPESESATLEFKASLPKRDQIVQTVVGFANMHGGRILVGVADNREVVGVPEEELEPLLEDLQKTIYEGTSPPIIADVHCRRIADRLVLVIRVSPGGGRPYYVRSLGLRKGVFVRLGRSTMRADAATTEDLTRQARGISFDSMPFHVASADDLSRKLFEAFLRSRPAGFSGHVSDDLLAAYRLIAQEHAHEFPTPAGLLLFSDNPQFWFPEAFMICSRFKGTQGRDALAAVDCRGSLFDQFEKAMDFVLEHLEKNYRIGDRRRIEEYEIPPVAIREILLNAIVHRDYALAGPAKTAIYDDRIEIFSPGVFPGPIDVHNITSGVTYIRNAAIARVFREAGYIEKLGSGFITVFDAYSRAGLRKPEVIEGTGFVKCILPRERERGAADRETEAVEALFSRMPQVSVSDIMREVGLSRATAGRRLQELQRKGAVRRLGKGPSTRYIKK